MQKEIKLRIVGTGVFTTIERKAFKATLDKEGKDKLKKIVESYNKKPSEYWMKRISSFFSNQEKISLKKIEAKKKKNKAKEKKKEVKQEKTKAKAQERIADVVAGAVKTAETLGTKEDVVENKTEEVKKIAEQAKPSSSYGYRRPGEY